MEFIGSRFSNHATPRNGLTKIMSYSQSKPHALYHQVPSRRPGALLATAVTRVRLPSHSHAAIRMPAIATTPEVISSVRTRPCSSSVVSGSTPCNGGTIIAPTKIDSTSSTSSGMWWVIPFPA
ncbi:hypothetical protein D3C85_1338370 [compost metagenome]